MKKKKRKQTWFEANVGVTLCTNPTSFQQTLSSEPVLSLQESILLLISDHHRDKREGNHSLSISNLSFAREKIAIIFRGIFTLTQGDLFEQK